MPIAGTESNLQFWTDYHLCQWTEVRSTATSSRLIGCLFEQEVPQQAAAKYFVQLNEKHLSSIKRTKDSSVIITFSHFFTSKYARTGVESISSTVGFLISLGI